MTAVMNEVLLDETTLLRPCHSVCSDTDDQTIQYGICGEILTGAYATPSDPLCSQCVIAGEEYRCRHCHKVCWGVLDARNP